MGHGEGISKAQEVVYDQIMPYICAELCKHSKGFLAGYRMRKHCPNCKHSDNLVEQLERTK